VGERQRLARVAIVALSGIAVITGIWLGLRSPEAVPVIVEAGAGTSVQTSATAGPGGSASTLVHVSGAVVAPGLVVLEEGDRVADAIAGAGGVLPYADLSAINLAGTLTDGQQIIVPGGGASSGSGGPVPTAPDDGLVHLNTATTAELERLPGIGEVLALRIVARRESNGPFETVEDLLDVPGIGERKLTALRDLAAVP